MIFSAISSLVGCGTSLAGWWVECGGSFGRSTIPAICRSLLCYSRSGWTEKLMSELKTRSLLEPRLFQEVGARGIMFF
ncbi:hypothetical protein [Microcoleus vaginatus]|uniref:hypothetical protein n=1 Tax=Microcoleus vaginatus TaxID=119532 RepID=UPI001F6001A3|nr:hypothetical protein D0A37_17860 [Microcoleus vaginatus HSN003]